jgi:outer membrane lipoprotein-sorting protein
MITDRFRRHHRERWLFSLFLLTGLAVGGCPDGRRGTHVPEAQRLTRPEDLLAAVKERGRRLLSLRVTGTIDMRRENKRIKAHMIYIAQRPAQLRFETESFFEQPLSILVTDGMTFSAWDMEHGRFFRGRASEKNIVRVIPVPMQGPDVTALLMGEPPLIPYARAALAWDEAQWLYRLSLSNSSLSQEVWIHPQRLRPEKVILRDSAGILYHLEYTGWQADRQEPAMPSRLTFEMPREDLRMNIRIQQVEINPELKPELFVLVPPDNLEIEDLDQE